MSENLQYLFLELPNSEASGLGAGYKKGQLEIARKLKGLGIPLNAIQEATGLSDEEIKAL